MDDASRLAELRQMKRRATAILLVVSGAFVALALTRPGGTWAAYALAAAEGSMVGGLADWFAVTALFRHPLGLPIPHTAIIRERKDQFGETLGSFVQQNFLSAEVVAERIRAANLPSRLAAWLCVEANAAKVAAWVVDGLVATSALVDDDDVQALLHDEVDHALRSIPLGPIAGRALRTAVDQHRHEAAVDAVLRGAMAFLEDQREPLRAQFGEKSPWWLPGAVEDRIFDRVVDGALLVMAAVAAAPDHELRHQIDDRLVGLSERLEHDPETARRISVAVGEALAQGQLRQWTRELWTDVKVALGAQASDPQSRLRAGLTRAVTTVGGRLGEDPSLQARMAGVAESGVRYVTEHHHDEISSLISATIARWDGEETSTKLELLLGRDLQFIRINGTVVGGLAGLAIHTLAGLLG